MSEYEVFRSKWVDRIKIISGNLSYTLSTPTATVLGFNVRIVINKTARYVVINVENESTYNKPKHEEVLGCIFTSYILGLNRMHVQCKSNSSWQQALPNFNCLEFSTADTSTRALDFLIGTAVQVMTEVVRSLQCTMCLVHAVQTDSTLVWVSPMKNVLFPTGEEQVYFSTQEAYNEYLAAATDGKQFSWL